LDDHRAGGRAIIPARRVGAAPAVAAGGTPAPGSPPTGPAPRSARPGRPQSPARSSRAAQRRAGAPGAGQGAATPVVKIVLLVLCLPWLIPTLGISVTSFRTPEAALTSAWWTVITSPLDFTQYTLANYREAWNGGMGDAFINSFAVVLPATIIPIMIAAFAAYAFTFMQFPGRDTLFVIVVALLVVPNQVALVPLLRLYTAVGLTGQYAAVYSHPGRLVDRRLPARQPSGSGRLAADRDGHVARHPGPGPKPPIGHRAVHRALLPARRLRRPAPRAHRPRHAGRGRQRRAAAPLDVDELAALWEGRPLQLKDIEAIADHLPGARLRYADFFAALAGAFDRGHWSNEDVDLAILTVPTLLSRAEADAAMRVVLEDYGHYATGRKPRQGEDALLVLDEFSALASGVDSAINLAERVRDVGVQVVVAAQSVEGLGDHRQAPRLLASCAGGIVVHQCPDPERLLALAGMVRTLEHNWELDYYGPRGLAKARMGEQPRIDPEQVRQAQPGEAWVIQPASPSTWVSCHRPPGPLSQRSRPLASRWSMTPSRCQLRSRRRSGSPRPSPSPVTSCAERVSGSVAGGAGRAAAHAGPAAVAARAAPARAGPTMRSPLTSRGTWRSSSATASALSWPAPGAGTGSWSGRSNAAAWRRATARSATPNAPGAGEAAGGGWVPVRPSPSSPVVGRSWLPPASRRHPRPPPPVAYQLRVRRRGARAAQPAADGPDSTPDGSPHPRGRRRSRGWSACRTAPRLACCPSPARSATATQRRSWATGRARP
jgi:hypothetical protein